MSPLPFATSSPSMPRTPLTTGSATHRSGSGSLTAAFAVAGCLVAGVNVAADYASLSQIEGAQETRDYSQQIRDKKFAADQRTYLTDTLLPQLAKDANRTGITQTRQRIRALALRDAAKELVDPINGVLSDAMVRQAAAEADPVVRVNAMLLVGELVGADGKPWPAAAKPLADATANATLPLEVRIAALAGLAKHVSAAVAGAPELTAIAGPAVAGLVTAPPAGDPVASRWLVAQALRLLPALAPPPPAIEAASKILADQGAHPDLRVRAAAALGKLSRPEAGVNATAAVDEIRSVAVGGLEAELAAAEQRRLARRLSGGAGLQSGLGWRGGEGSLAGAPFPPGGGAPFGGAPVGGLGGDPGLDSGLGEGLGMELDEDAVPPLACRRAAWRLHVLAEAIRPGRSGPGLAELLSGDAAAAADDLATTLRQAALDLDAQPDEPTLKLALASIKEAGPADQQPPGGTKPAAGAAPAASPFEAPAQQSPF